MPMPLVLRALIAAGLLSLATASPAAVVWSFSEAGGNVFGSMAGSIDLTGLQTESSSKSGSGLRPVNGELFSGPNGAILVVRTAFASELSTNPFGAGDLTVASSTTGDIFAMQGDDLALPADYVSGASLSGTLTYLNASFAGLGITPGSYRYDLINGDSMTLNFGDAAAVPVPVPVPGTLALAGLGFGLLALARRRRPRQQRVSSD